MKILTSNVSDTSAKKLRDAIVKITGNHFFVTKDPRMITKGPFIRYGCGYDVAIKDTDFNSAAFINLCISKMHFSKFLKKAGFHVPIFYKNNTLPKKFPVLIRQSLERHAGQGIVICRNQQEFDANWHSCYYWTPFIKTDFEIRAYVCGDKVVKIFDKVAKKPEKDLPIRSNYDFVDRNMDFYPKVQKLISKISNVLPGHIYSLDMAWDAAKGEYFIFEGNSGSWMSPSTAEVTAKYLVNAMKL